MPYITKTRTLPRTFWQWVFRRPAKTEDYRVWDPTSTIEAARRVRAGTAYSKRGTH